MLAGTFGRQSKRGGSDFCVLDKSQIAVPSYGTVGESLSYANPTRYDMTLACAGRIAIPTPLPSTKGMVSVQCTNVG